MHPPGDLFTPPNSAENKSPVDGDGERCARGNAETAWGALIHAAAQLLCGPMPLSEPLRARFQDLITKDQVVLFMKGTRGAPACGFSAAVVQILDDLVPTYETVNVLANAEVRDGIKEFSLGRPSRSSTFAGSSWAGATSFERCTRPVSWRSRSASRGSRRSRQ